MFKQALHFGKTIKQDSTYIFPSERKEGPVHRDTTTHAFRDIAIKLELNGANLYCLKHTVKTGLARLGIPKDIRDRTMNHNMKQSDVGDGYDHYDYYDECFDALFKWQDHLKNIMGIGVKKRRNSIGENLLIFPNTVIVRPDEIWEGRAKSIFCSLPKDL